MGAANTAFNNQNQAGIGPIAAPALGRVGVAIEASVPEKLPKKRTKKLPPQQDVNGAMEPRSGGKPPQPSAPKNPVDVMLGVGKAPGSYRK